MIVKPCIYHLKGHCNIQLFEPKNKVERVLDLNQRSQGYEPCGISIFPNSLESQN